jgi:hypothetical protein
MIKKLHEILLKDVILLDATKKAGHLKKYWFIPIYFCRSGLEKLAEQMFQSIGGSTIESLETEFDKLASFQRLQILEALYKAVQIELDLRVRVNVWKLLMEKDYSESDTLKEVLNEVLKYTGIDIKTPEDMKRFEDHIEFKIDKHRENYTVAQPEGEPVNLSRIIYSVFNYMGEPYAETMRLITFIELKAMAEERIKQSEKQRINGSK